VYRSAVKVVKTIKIPISGPHHNVELLEGLLVDEQQIINDSLILLGRLRPPRLSLHEAIKLFGRRSSEHYVLRSTRMTKQIYAEGIATKVYQQHVGQSNSFRRWMFRQARLSDRLDFTILHGIVVDEGGTWAGLRRAVKREYLPFGVTPETASELTRAERVPIRKVREPLAFLRSRTFRFVRTRRGNYGVVFLHPWVRRKQLFFRVVGHGGDKYIEQLLKRHGQEKGTATGELRGQNGRLVLCVLFAREVPVPTYVPQTYVGVDLGYVNVAVAAAVDPHRRRLLHPKFWSARMIRTRLRTLNARDAAHRSHGKNPVTTADFRRYWTYRVAREVVEFAKGFPAPALVLEDLSGIRNRPRNWGRRANGEFYNWDYRRMGKFIEHVAGWESISVVKVPPRGTSSSCPRCGGAVSRNRRRHASKCLDPACGYENNDDLVGAFNIALRGVAHGSAASDASSESRGLGRTDSTDRSISTMVHPEVESLSSAGSDGVNSAVTRSKAVT